MNIHTYLEKTAKSDKNARPVDVPVYRNMRQAALYSSGMSNKDRLNMLQKAFEGRGEDKRTSRSVARVTAGLGGVTGLIGGVGVREALRGMSGGGLVKVPKGGKLWPVPTKLQHAIVAAMALGGGLLGHRTGHSSAEKKRKFAKRISENPTAIQSILQAKRRTGFFGRRRMKQEAARIRDLSSARKGKKPSNPWITVEK